MIRQGWVSVAVWMSFGLLLEGLLGYKIPTYLNDPQRRELFQLAHTHGTLLGLVLIGAALCGRAGAAWPPGQSCVAGGRGADAIGIPTGRHLASRGRPRARHLDRSAGSVDGDLRGHLDGPRTHKHVRLQRMNAEAIRGDRRGSGRQRPTWPNRLVSRRTKHHARGSATPFDGAQDRPRPPGWFVRVHPRSSVVQFSPAMRPSSDTRLVWTGAPCSSGCEACPIDPGIAPAGLQVAELQQRLAGLQAGAGD